MTDRLLAHCQISPAERRRSTSSVQEYTLTSSMILKHQFIRNVSALAVAAGIIHSSATLFAQTYSLTPLGVLPDKKESSATALNDAGQIAGIAHAGPGTEAAVRYTDPAVAEDLAQHLVGSGTGAYAINANGH